MKARAIAAWTADGFFHPAATLEREFVDSLDFIHVPLAGLANVVQFARLSIDTQEFVVFGSGSDSSRSELAAATHARWNAAACVFVSAAQAGAVKVCGGELSERGALAAALTQFVCAWDDTPDIEVGDERHTYVVQVSQTDGRYALSVRSG
jgi:hypothetical protein